MADIARLGFSVDTSGLVRAERAIESLDRAARGLRDISLSVNVSGAAEAMRQLDGLDGRNIAARVTVDVAGADALQDIERLSANRATRIDVTVTGISEALRDIDRLAVNRATRIDVIVTGIDALRSIDNLANNRSILINANITGISEALRDLDRIAVNRSIRIDANITGINEALRDLDRLAVNRTVRIDASTTGISEALRDIDRLSVNRATRIDVTVTGINEASRDLDRLVVSRSIRIDTNVTGINDALRDIDRLAVNRSIRINANVTGISEALRDIDRIAVNRTIRIDATVTGISEALRDINRLSGGARGVRIDVGINGVEAALRGLRDIERLAVNRTVRIDINTGDIGGAIRDLERLAREAREAAGEINGLGANVNVTSVAFGGLKTVVGAVLGILAGGQIAQGINDVIQYNAEINLLTQSLQVSRGTLQTWSIAGRAAGLDMGSVFKDISEKIGDFAATGGGEGADVFKRLKLDVKELIALSPDQQLLKIVDAMSKVKGMSQGEKIFLLESLANDSSKLLPILDDNAAKLRELDQLARSSGAIITDEQNANLTEAKGNLDKLALSMKGAGNAAADVGAQIVNAIAGDAMDAVSGLDDAIYRQAENVKIMADAWVYAYETASEAGHIYAADTEGWFTNLMEMERIGWTYLPVWAGAAYTAIDEKGREWNLSAQAMVAQFRADWRSGMADMIDAAAAAYDTVANIAIKTGNNIFGGNTPEQHTVVQYATDLRAAATELEGVAKARRYDAETAKYAAERAINSAAAYQVESEQRRTLNAEMGIAERQFAALGSGLDATGTKAQTFRVNQEAVNKALNDTEGEAKKAANGLKELSAPWLSGSVAFKSEIEAAASRFGVDANLVKAVIQQETGFLKDAQKQLKAVSPAGAKGIMQVMPGTAAMVAKEIGMTNYSLFRAADNITLGTAYLSQQLAKYNGDISKVAAAYNAGPGAVDKYAGIPPYKETQGYVKNVLGYYAELTKGVDNSGKAQIQSILEVEKTRLEAAKKIADEKAQLEAEVEKAKTSTLGGYAIDLRVQGVGADDRTEMVALKSAAALAQLQRQAEATRMEATLSKEAFMEWQLVNEEGFAPSVAAAQAALESSVAQTQQLGAVWDSVTGKMEDALLDTIMTGEGDWSGLIDYMIREALRLQVIQPIMNSLFGGAAGGGGGGFNLFSLFGFANGGAFGSNGVQAYANGGAFHNSILTKPTQFFANGGLAVAGEAGAEAVMPLTRIGGRLGVQAVGGGANVTVQNRIEIINNGSPTKVAKQEQSTDNNGNALTRIWLEEVKNSIAGDISSRRGSVYNALRQSNEGNYA